MINYKVIAQRALEIYNAAPDLGLCFGLEVEDIYNILIDCEKEAINKDIMLDSTLDYNDEIVSIEPLGEMELMDIGVSENCLFYGNGILTKNSFGIAHTADIILGMVSTEEMEALNQLLFIQLKNRYNDLNYYKRFIVGIDRSRMRLYNVEASAQSDLVKDTPAFDNTPSGRFDKSKFKDFA